MSTLVLSGWAQPADALVPLTDDAVTFDYSDYPTPAAAIEALKNIAHTQCVAWSLGGQLALRAIAAGAIQPHHLTLIAAPCQFVGPHGMGPETFALFRASYAENPARTKDRFHALIAKGDADGKRIMTKLRHHPDVENTARWLPWLDALASYSLADASLARSPRTLIIHGMNDAIVPLAQSEILLAKLPRATLQRWEQTGHAPHLHDAARLRAAIAAHRAAT